MPVMTFAPGERWRQESRYPCAAWTAHVDELGIEPGSLENVALNDIEFAFPNTGKCALVKAQGGTLQEISLATAANASVQAACIWTTHRL